MAYFHCLIGGGSSGGGYELTVTCDADFAGTTITCTDGVTTLTQTCPSASPYEVVFAIPNGGEWTISGIISGQTYSTAIDIPDSLELHSVPEGSTVTPTDVIQTWLSCAGITDKAYTTLNEVLADSTTLLALISDNNASDYMVRSTTWASGLTTDSTAMTDIGANNYCANTLLADSTWLTAICNSTYFESVLNVKVPTMTSNTTPEGECFATASGGGVSPYHCFDNNLSTLWGSPNNTKTAGIGYIFTSPVVVLLFKIIKEYYTSGSSSANIQYSDDGNTWNNVFDSNFTITHSNSEKSFVVPFTSSHKYWRLYETETNNSVAYYELQFYGREDV